VINTQSIHDARSEKHQVYTYVMCLVFILCTVNTCTLFAPKSKTWQAELLLRWTLDLTFRVCRQF